MSLACAWRYKSPSALLKASRFTSIFFRHKLVKMASGEYKLDFYMPRYPSEAFFTALDGIAAVENDTVYPWTAEAGGEALVSGNAGQHQSESAIQLTFQKAAALTFAYRTSSETRRDFLKISKNGTALNDSYQEKANFSGEMTDYGT